MALSDILLYYIASHLMRALDWSKHQSLKQWVLLEQEVSPMPSEVLLWLAKMPTPELLKQPTIGATWKIFCTAFDYYGIAPLPSPQLPILDLTQDKQFLQVKQAQKW